MYYTVKNAGNIVLAPDVEGPSNSAVSTVTVTAPNGNQYQIIGIPDNGIACAAQHMFDLTMPVNVNDRQAVMDAIAAAWTAYKSSK